MLAVVPKYKRYTIESYAHYVLDDPKVKALIDRFTTYRKAADKVIDAFEGLVDFDKVTFDNEEELRVAREFNQSTEECKNVTLTNMITDINDHESWLDISSLGEIINRNASEPHPNKTDIPLIMFREFTTNEFFKDYLFKSTVSLMSGAYFSKDIDLARQKYLVFATFIWAYMNPHTVAGGKSDTFYDYAEVTDVSMENNILSKPYFHTLSAIIQTLDTSESTISERLDFLATFKDYIHFDMWNGDDYAKRMKTGTVLRLGLEMEETGNVIIQACGDRSNICNTTYLINAANLADLKKKYLKPDTVLKKLGTFFNCRYCLKPTATILTSYNGDIHLYCNLRCYNKCKK